MKQMPCEVYTRVVGYFRPISQTNKGKMEEINTRLLFDANTYLKETTHELDSKHTDICIT